MLSPIRLSLIVLDWGSNFVNFLCYMQVKSATKCGTATKYGKQIILSTLIVLINLTTLDV